MSEQIEIVLVAVGLEVEISGHLSLACYTHNGATPPVPTSRTNQLAAVLATVKGKSLRDRPPLTVAARSGR